VPEDARAMIDQWLAEQQTEDVQRRLLPGERLPMLILEARDFGADLEQFRARDLDILEPDLVRAIEDFGGHVGQAMQFWSFAEQGLGDPAGNRETALMTVVDGARDFARVFARYEPRYMEIRELTGRQQRNTVADLGRSRPLERPRSDPTHIRTRSGGSPRCSRGR
jgi:hypothetical protein